LSQAVALAQQTGQPANINAVRFYQSRPGVSLNIEQQITPDFGFFSRLGWAGGKTEAYEYSDIDYTAKAGFALNGNRWGRPNDTIGVGYEIDGLSKDAITFFNAGGLGIVIGDGQLPHYATEKVIEAYYSYAISDSMKVTADYQYVQNPGYNTDRGPVSVFAGRLHLQF